MRFSIKWALAAMAYVALAAAALTQPRSWLYGDVLWLAAFLAFGYAVLVASFSHGSRRAIAVGFAVLACCYLVPLKLAPDSLPTSRLFSVFASQPQSQQQVFWAAPATATPQPVIAPAASPQPPTYYPQPTPLPAYAPPPLAPAAAFTVAYPTTLTPQQLRAANAIAAMAAGLIGCGLGALAYRRGQNEQSATA